MQKEEKFSPFTYVITDNFVAVPFVIQKILSVITFLLLLWKSIPLELRYTLNTVNSEISHKN